MSKTTFWIIAGVVWLGAIGIIAGPSTPPLASAKPSSAASTQPDDPARAYRMWAAEQMKNRLSEKIARARPVCALASAGMTGISEKKCKAAAHAGPFLTLVADLASTANAALWAKLIDGVHELEADLDGPTFTR